MSSRHPARKTWTCGGCDTAAGDRLATALAVGMRLSHKTTPTAGFVVTCPTDMNVCSICSEAMVEVASNETPFILLDCQHAFHVDCITTWYDSGSDSNKKSCPVCRKKITDREVRMLRDNRLALVRTRDGVATYSRNGCKLYAVHPDGSKRVFSGLRGAERQVRIVQRNGTTQFYLGQAGTEHLVRTEFASGSVLHYKGAKNAEHYTESEQTRGTTKIKAWYTGEKGNERLVTREHGGGMSQPNGRTDTFEGPSKQEYLVSSAYPKETVVIYTGTKHAERVLRIEFRGGRDRPNGATKHYEGERGAEHHVRTDKRGGQDRPNGVTMHYEGVKGVEHHVRTEWYGGKVDHFVGAKGFEKPVVEVSSTL